MISQVKQHFDEVNGVIAEAAARVGRNRDEITLIGVTKTHPAELVAEGVEAGLVHLGENRFQEVPEKQEKLRELIGENEAAKLVWHFIGQLQSNKVRAILEHFSVIQSIDRAKLIDRIDRIAGEMNIQARGLIQLNVSGAKTQGGVSPEDFVGLAREASGRKHLAIEGIMAIGPLTNDELELRRAFRRAVTAAREVDELDLPGVDMQVISMGMSGDFRIAIEEGATHVRVGSAIFGRRG